MFCNFFLFYFSKINYNLILLKLCAIFQENNVNKVAFLLKKQKILSEIKIIKYCLIFVEINFIEWYNIEKSKYDK